MDILKDIHIKLTEFPRTITFQEFDHYLHDISIRYNMDKRSLIQKYFNYLIRDGIIQIQQLSNVLDKMQVIMHRPDIPIDVHIEYLYRMHQSHFEN
jgi:hypothetical protein